MSTLKVNTITNLLDGAVSFPGGASIQSPVLNGLLTGTGVDIASRAPIQPSLDLDFANQKYRVLDGELGLRSIALADVMTYTGSGRTYVGQRGQVMPQSSNAPRLTFDATTGVGLGLSVWGARTNLLTYSEQFSDASWSQNNVTISANVLAAPDGSATADKLAENSSLNYHTVWKASSFTSGTDYTYSVFAKAGERSFLGIIAGATATFPARAVFNLSAGTVVALNGAATIKSVGSGWFLCTVTATATATASTGVNLSTQLDSTYSQYTGDGTSGLFIWGAQLEAASTASPYIPTTTAAITAPADVASITGSNFSKWFNAAEGTFVVAFTPNMLQGATFSQHVISARDSAGTSFIDIHKRANADGSTRFSVVKNGAADVTFANLGVFAVSATRIAASYIANNSNASLGGAAVLNDALVEIPVTLDRLFIGSDSGAFSALNGTIQRILYFPKSLASNLQALSA